MRPQDCLNEIAQRIEQDLTQSLECSGMMYRLFYRVKTLRSVHHKMEMKGDAYRRGEQKMQDIIGFRVVVYFSDDVEVLSFFLGTRGTVRASVDEPDSSTFCPQRLNLTRSIPPEYVDDFRKSLPQEYLDYIDSTYEVQIRTVFSEGWHEVEHDLRYKCKSDWVGCEQYGRTLNGVIATLETAEWSMKSLFHEMSHRNFLAGNYRAMLRNKMRIRLKDEGFSTPVQSFLDEHREVAKGLLKTDRFVFVLSMLTHKQPVDLTFDNVLFLVNRLDIHDEDLKALEGEQTRNVLDEYLKGE